MAILAQLALVVWRWKTHRWGALVPLIACGAALPLGGVAGHFLISGRLSWNRAHYEAVADGRRAGTYSPPLHPEDASLGYWVNAHEWDGRVTGSTGLLFKAPPELFVRHEFGQHQLEGALCAGAELVDHVHGPHPALAEGSNDSKVVRKDLAGP